MRKSIRRATIKSLARQAGVSVTTVSRALNNKPDVNPDTRARILTLAEVQGYTPSTIALSLVTQRTHTIGLAVRTIADMWVVGIVPAIEQIARDAGKVTYRIGRKGEAIACLSRDLHISERVELLKSRCRQEVPGRQVRFTQVDTGRENQAACRTHPLTGHVLVIADPD